jgi:exonuclease SbcC
MKPLKLKFKAFGPFLEEQEIDFENLKNDGLFLVTGPTGAGKTTIFDAICFALYGNGSMGERGNANSRSDFADENTDTFVEFEFMLKDKKIKINRTPTYMRAKKRGDGLTEQKTTADIKIYKNEEIISESYGATEVTDKVEEYLNLNYDQFRQIMMIPQGEFRNFILAGSDKRAEIFKKIFDISIYEKFENKISEKYGELEKILKDFKLKTKTIAEKVSIDSEEYQELLSSEYINTEELISQISVEIEKNEKMKNQIKEEKTNKQNKQKELNSHLERIKKDNEKLNKKEEIQKELQELLKNEENIKTKEKQLEKILKAEKIIPYEEKYNEYKQQLSEKQKELEKQNKVLEESLKKQDIINQNFPKIERDYQKISAIKKEVEDLNKKLEKIKTLNKTKTEHKEILENIKNEEDKFEKIEAKISENKEEFEKNEDFINKNEDINIEILENKLQEISKIYNSTKSLNQKYTEFENIDSNFKKSKKVKEDNEGLVKKLRSEYHEKTQKLIDSQSYFLASKLVEGEPCPVCGSKHHPSPAQKNKDTVTEEELKTLNEKLQKQEKQNSETQKKFEEISREYNETASFVISEYKRICGELELSPKDKKEIKIHLEEIINTLEDSLKKRKEEFDKKSKISQEIKNKKANNKKLKEQLKSLEEQKESQNKQINILKTQEISLKKDIQNLSEQIENKTEEQIQKSIEENKDFIEKTEKNYNQIKNESEETSKTVNSVKGTIKTLKLDIENLTARVSQEKKNFEAMILKMEFQTIEEYDTFKKQTDNIKYIEKEIKEYRENIQNKKSVLNDLEKSTQDIKKINEIPLSKMIEKIAEEIESMIKQESNLEYKIKDLKDTIESIETIKKETAEKEKEFETIKSIKDISTGNNNSKISLSKYVLAYYFEEILSRANQRLKKLTENRYRLYRASKVIDARKKEGLEIMVFDNYTAKKREIKTLSGGESFKAALSLALGLADVVQSHSGGVALDTIFIDEGFGSLDTNSLDNAIEVLTDLHNSGRMVGIISHVSELKERINSKIEIIPNKQGSNIKI